MTPRSLLPALPIALLAAVLFFSGSCTDVQLERIPAEQSQRDDKLTVSGDFCTRRPETLIFPLRVLFVVDASVSMEITDPPDPVTGETGREIAIRETWQDLLSQGVEGISVGIIRFSAQAQSRTPVDDNGDGIPDSYFTSDETQLLAATSALGITDRTTNYINALSETYLELRTELLAAEFESLPLSKYVVVFVSDGIPDVDSSDDRGNNRDQILESVEAINQLISTFRVGTFAFHTAYIASGQAAFDADAQDLLKSMANIGGGNFRSFPNGEELNFLFVDFSVLRRIFTLKTFLAVNTNSVMDNAQITPIAIPAVMPAGTNMGAGATAGSPMIDMTNMAFDASGNPIPFPDPYMFLDLDGDRYPGCGEPLVDSDGDGLSDMVEIEFGTHPLVPDTDDDGLKDDIEWDLRDDGLDPLNPDDAQCFVPAPCVDEDPVDGLCDCLSDRDEDGICDCVNDPDEECLTPQGHDCIDEDLDGWCDCPDLDGDGRCDYRDRDNDGLNDCEEVLFGTAQRGIDTDADGIPDVVEVRFKTSPGEDDVQEDLDADTTLNGIEILAGTNPNCPDAPFRSRIAYRYALQELGIDDSRTCYDFEVSNITLLPTLDTGGDTYPGNGWNRILFYAGEVAFDDPDAFARFRIACVEAAYHPDENIRNPPSGRFALEEADFVDVLEFDPILHCKRP